MPIIANLTAHGQKQGDIKGGATEKGRENSIPVFSFSHEIDSPRDPASGLPTGKRVHKPITIVKAVDPATPLLLQAFVSNETLTTVKIEFWRPVPEASAPYFIIALTNASVASVALSPTSEGLSNECEQVQFTYQQIMWTYPETGDSAEDDWEASA